MLPRKTVAFVIPLGYSFNLTGTTLYLSLATIFVAQVAGMHLTWGQQLSMMLILMLASKGVAGVSRAPIIILLATADQFGLPKDPILILLGVDQLMDMGRMTAQRRRELFGGGHRSAMGRGIGLGAGRKDSGSGHRAVNRVAHAGQDQGCPAISPPRPAVIRRAFHRANCMQAS